jgi:defect in organelle trafficking protein DotD
MTISQTASRLQAAVTVAAVSVVVMTGCATSGKASSAEDANAVVDRQILTVAERILNAQEALYQAGAINQVAPQAAPTSSAAPISSNQQAINLTWQGDAIELLQRLSTERGLEFATTGVPLPLPLSIHARQQSFERVLQLVRMQVGYRATVSQAAHHLVLQYNAPQP